MNSHVVDTDVLNGSQLIVGLSDLPGGDYMVWATIANGGDNVNSDSMQCRLDGPNGEVSPGTFYSVGPEIDYGFATTLTGVVEDAPDGFNLDVYCGKNSALIDDTPPEANADIEAIPIGALH